MSKKIISIIVLFIIGTVLNASGINTSPFDDDRTVPNVELLNQRQYKFYDYGYYPQSNEEGGNIYLAEFNIEIEEDSRNSMLINIMVHSTKEETSRILNFEYFNSSFAEKSWRRFLDSKLSILTDNKEHIFIDESPIINPPWLKSFSFYLEKLSIQEISDIVDSVSLRFFIDIEEIEIPDDEKTYIQRFFRDFLLKGINYYDLDYLFNSGIRFIDEAQKSKELMEKATKITK